MKKVIIFGGTGFIGTSVAKYISSKGFYPIVIGRTKTNESFKFVKWDGMNAGEWECELNNAFAIINLVGKSVDCIKTPKNIDEILKKHEGNKPMSPNKEEEEEKQAEGGDKE